MTVIRHIRKEIPIDVPGNGFPMRRVMESFVDTDKNGIVSKAEWDASEAFAKDKFNADRFAANDFIYVVNTSGTFAVLRAGDSLDVAAVNKLGESVRCTPAIAGNRLYVRGADHLWAFGQ